MQVTCSSCGERCLSHPEMSFLMSSETLVLPVNVLHMEIGMTRAEASLCPSVNETHWQRRQSQGRNKKDDRGAVDEVQTAEHGVPNLQVTNKN